MNANPQFIRAWQYIQQQQQHVYNQQVTGPTLNPSSLHPSNMVSQQQNSYQMYQGSSQIPQSSNTSRSAQSSRYSYTQLQQPGISNTQPLQPQQWSPVPNQPPRFRTTGSNNLSQQPNPQQFSSIPCYQQPVKVPGPQSAMQPNPPQRFVNQLNMAHPSQQLQTNQVPISPSTLSRGPGGLVPQITQLSRCPDNPSSASSGNLMSGPVGGGVGPNRSTQPSPHYSSVMLSQLLGPGQAMNPNSTPVSLPEYAMHPNNKQHLSRQDFVPPPAQNMLPVHPHYQDGNV